MRAIFIFFIPIILILTSCSSIKVAKEISKVTQKSIEASINKITDSKDNEPIIQDAEMPQEEMPKEESLGQTIAIEKKLIIEEKKKIGEIILKQKKVTKLNLMGKTFIEINQLIGQPNLVRKDRQTTTIRYDSESCFIFVFMNTKIKNSRVEYYELRNDLGELIDREKDIEECFEEIKKV